MNSDTQHETSTNKSDLTKDLEKEKLELEIAEFRLRIAELSRPWWRKPAHLVTLLGICSLNVAFLTATYQSMSAKLDAQAARLDTEKTVFGAEKKSFELERSAILNQRDEATRSAENYKSQLAAFTQQLESQTQELSSAKQELAALKRQQFSDRLTNVLASIEKTQFRPINGTMTRPPSVKPQVSDQVKLFRQAPQIVSINWRPDFPVRTPVKKTWYQSLKGKIAYYIP